MVKAALDLSVYTDKELKDLVKKIEEEKARRGQCTKSKIARESNFWTEERYVHWCECINKKLRAIDPSSMDVLKVNFNGPVSRIHEAVYTICDFTLGNFKIKTKDGQPSAYQNGSYMSSEMHDDYLDMYCDLFTVIDKYMEKGMPDAKETI